MDSDLVFVKIVEDPDEYRIQSGVSTIAESVYTTAGIQVSLIVMNQSKGMQKSVKFQQLLPYGVSPIRQFTSVELLVGDDDVFLVINHCGFRLEACTTFDYFEGMIVSNILEKEYATHWLDDLFTESLPPQRPQVH
jgi:hypothetical protein